MAKNSFLGANVEVSYDTFGSFVDKTNRIIYELGTSVLTASPVPIANNTNGAMTVGNSHLEGVLTSNEFATKIIRGGNMPLTDDLILASNLNPSDDSINFGNANNRFNNSYFVFIDSNNINNDKLNSNNIITVDLSVTSNANIKNLFSNNANIETLKSSNGNINDLTTITLKSTIFNTVNGSIENLTVNTGNISKLDIVNDLSANNFNVNNKIIGSIIDINTGRVGALSSDGIDTHDIKSNTIIVYEKAIIKDLEILGETKLSSNIEFSVNTSVSNIMTVKEQFIVRGDSVIGNTSNNKLKINSSIDSNIIPNGNSVYNIGTSNNRFNDIYAKNIFVANAVLDYAELKMSKVDDLNIGNTLTTNNIISSQGNISGNFKVDGILDLNPSLVFTTNTSKTNSLEVVSNGFIKNLVVGNTIQDSLEIKGSLASNLLPKVTQTYNLGSSNTKFNDIFTKNITSDTTKIAELYSSNANISGTLIANNSTISNLSVGNLNSTIEITGAKITSNNFSGTYNGNGSNITNINANNISTGTINDNRLPSTQTGKTFTSELKVGNTIINTTGDIFIPYANSNLSTLLNSKQSSLGFIPVQQGTGIGQSNNVVKIGWTGKELKVTVDTTDMGKIWTDDQAYINSSDMRNRLGLGSMSTRNVTVSTGEPTGGNDGDIWLKI